MLNEHADQLLRLIRGLSIAHTYERSFKLSHGTLFGNRFLCGLRKERLGANADQRLIDLLQTIGMPAPALTEFRAHLPKSKYLLFGFEEQGNVCMYKTYLEFYEAAVDDIRRRTRPLSVARLMFLAFKWSANAPADHVTTHYHWYPELPLRETRERCTGFFPGDSACRSFVQSVLTEVETKHADRRIHYLDVSESDNPRRSFDINLYSTGMRVSDIEPNLSRLVDGLEIPRYVFDPLYAEIAPSSLGHLSGGVSRHGKEFVSVYYGVRKHSA